jgi:hypothetical protein
MSMYPRYSIWMDATSNTFEVVRWDSPRVMEPVQVNILTHDKALQALAAWQDRAATHKDPT